MLNMRALVLATLTVSLPCLPGCDGESHPSGHSAAGGPSTTAGASGASGEGGEPSSESGGQSASNGASGGIAGTSATAGAGNSAGMGGETGSSTCVGASDCTEHAACVNVGGDFECRCEDGYVGNGLTCSRPASAVVTGDAHTCALDESGGVSCWGWGGMFTALGRGNTAQIGDDETPASVGLVMVGGAVQQLSAGDDHTCALLTTGSVRCWGDNSHGQLGYGNTNSVGDDETPASAGDVNVGGTVKQVAAGGNHTCALLTTGAVRCWGQGSYGALGYGNLEGIGDDETPASAGDVDVGGVVQQLATGRYHTCALLTTGAVRCWGMGDWGVLGYGNVRTIGDDETPASAGDVDIGGPVEQLAARATHTCALLTTGNVRCWGKPLEGELGYADGPETIIGDDETPASAGDIDVGGRVREVSAGSIHTCALLTTGNVRCWGQGQWGALGYGNTNSIGDDEVPASAGDIDFGSPVEHVAAGGGHTCVLTTAHTIRCTGYGGQGALGYGNTNSIGDDEAPASAGDVPAL